MSSPSNTTLLLYGDPLVAYHPDDPDVRACMLCKQVHTRASIGAHLASEAHCERVAHGLANGSIKRLPDTPGRLARIWNAAVLQISSASDWIRDACWLTTIHGLLSALHPDHVQIQPDVSATNRLRVEERHIVLTLCVSSDGAVSATLCNAGVLHVKYAIIGAGDAGLHFLARCHQAKAGRVAVIEARTAIGGHWVDQYDYVRLHAPKCTYGIDSSFWSGDILNDLASKSEILEHYTRCMQPVLSDVDSTLPLLGYRASRRMVPALGPCVLCTEVDSAARTASGPLLLAARGIIDATTISFPWNSAASLGLPPRLSSASAADEGARGPILATPVELERVRWNSDIRFVVIGGGKSGCDCVLHLQRQLASFFGVGEQSNSVSSRLTWIISTPLAFFKREQHESVELGATLMALLQQHEEAPHLSLGELPSYDRLFHHFTDAIPWTTHGAMLGNDEVCARWSHPKLTLPRPCSKPLSRRPRRRVLWHPRPMRLCPLSPIFQ